MVHTDSGDRSFSDALEKNALRRAETPSQLDLGPDRRVIGGRLDRFRDLRIMREQGPVSSAPDAEADDSAAPRRREAARVMEIYDALRARVSALSEPPSLS
jgi:hypothetical protein